MEVEPRFMLMQNVEIVITVTIIIAKPNIKPILKVSIFLIQARGENRARTISPKYSCLKSDMPERARTVDLKPSIVKTS